ncbi:MAG: hypothetical protein ACRD5K_14860 [Candidatus Acidiferrales bacterium]
MSRIVKVAVLASVLALFGVRVRANTAASCATGDVQSAINSAAEGGTVSIPAGTCTWTSGVTISGKGVDVEGAGGGGIIAYSSNTLTIGTGAKSLTVSGTQVSGTPATPAAPQITSGETLRISELGNRQNYMLGTVTSFNSGTGALAMSVASDGGSCGNSSSGQSPSNCKRWLVSTIPQTVIINNSSSTIFSVTEDSSFNTRLGNFKIQEGTGSGDGVDFNSGGGEPIVLHDCWIEQGNGDSVRTAVNRGLIYNCSFDSTPFSMAPLAVHLQPFDLNAWGEPSYFGTKDTNGQHNFYVESSVFAAYLNATDNDEGARSVWRYSTFDNAGFGTHGADTGPIGQRYFEYYENVGVYNGYSDGTTFPMNWWFFVRGGTFVIFDNTLPPLVSTDYGTKGDVNMTVMNLQRNAGPLPCWGAGTSGGSAYYAPHQVGLGYVTGKGIVNFVLGGLVNAVTYSIASYGYSTPQYVGDPEPAYIWGNGRVPLGNVGTSDYGSGGCANPDTSANYIKLNRDYFNGSTPKPGYSAYPYPHPLELNQSSSGGGPIAPTGLTATVQ